MNLILEKTDRRLNSSMTNANHSELPMISVGNVVRINHFSFEFPIGKSFPLDGMEGMITDLYSEDAGQIRLTHAQIRWTAETIRSISQTYVAYCAESDYSWTETVIPLEFLEIVDQAANESELQWAINDKAEELFWHASPEGRKLTALFRSVDPTAARFPGEILLGYLRKNLRLPMPVEIRYDTEGDDPENFYLQSGTKASLVELTSYDVRMNIYAEIVSNGRHFILPLEDLGSLERSESKNNRALNVYLFWLISRL